MLGIEDGSRFVKLARKSVGYALPTGNLLSEEAPKAEYNEERGVFVTISEYPSGNLRGCIGFPEPVKPLWQGIIEAAASAAFSDPRFSPLSAGELERVVFEVSVLTKPEKIVVKEAEDYLKEIKVGRDGLIVRRGLQSGLLLPQVAVELKWGEQEFLEQTCWKAGLDKNEWKEKGIEVSKFQAQIFKEEKPNGKVVEEK